MITACFCGGVGLSLQRVHALKFDAVLCLSFTVATTNHHSLALVSLVSKEFRKAAETMAVSHFRRHFGAAPPELLPRSRLLLFVDQTADPRYLPELVLWSAIHGYVCVCLLLAPSQRGLYSRRCAQVHKDDSIRRRPSGCAGECTGS